MVNVSDYWQKFPDGSPDRWKVDGNEEKWDVVMPNGAALTLRIDAPTVDFTSTFAKDSDSTRLWTNSLRYLLPILEKGDTATVESILKDFAEYLRSEFQDFGGSFSGSLDHQCALQLRTLCDIRSWLSIDGHGSIGTIDVEALSGLVASIYRVVAGYGLLRPNNHGVMLGIAMLHSFELFPDVEWKEGKNSVNNFLVGTLKKVLGTDGVANENTPVYQAFYLRLLEDIMAFKEWAGGGAERDFESLYELALSAYCHMLLPNKAVPPLGDASLSSQSRYSPKHGFWSSEENGLQIASSHDTFFSFVCGFRGVFHKQIDDTSVYLWHNGNALIQDGGLTSYDRNDKVAVSLRGQLGHSGLFFTEYDDVPAEKVVAFGPGKRLIDAKMSVKSVEAWDRFQVAGTTQFRSTQTHRTITWNGNRRFLIRDVVEGSPAAHDAVSRFLLDTKATIEIGSVGEVVVRSGSSWMSIYCGAPGTNVRISRGYGGEGFLPRGFMAPRNYQKAPTSLLEFPIAMDDNFSGKQVLYIAFGKVEEGIEPWIPGAKE
ncbi:heparinase II/III family protein [Corynebacterium sp. HMSC062A03]|uniref:heparinase II/III domain-containing protein n=1 Tax=Corynebacterium sp. HMSC062A03 TaxID=1739285 RepID=UPI00114CAB96|nr:heparinase II/III family protein [Corynebacterium sp. HMSC062A03]